MVDNFAKFIKVYTLKDRTALTASRYVYDYCLTDGISKTIYSDQDPAYRTALTASRHIYDYCLTYGIPETIYLDQDPAYEANLFNKLIKQLGVRKSKTTTYHPKANGLCEKSNGIVKSYFIEIC